MSAHHALVAGVTGIVERRIAEHLAANGWPVTGLARHSPGKALPYRLIAVDLTDSADCRAKLASMSAVTHVFYAARYDHPEGTAESVDINAAMLANLIEAIEPVARDLRHVNLVHGTKYYGHMLGCAWRTMWLTKRARGKGSCEGRISSPSHSRRASTGLMRIICSHPNGT